MSNTKTKRLNRRGTLTLPRDIRAEAGLLPGAAVDIVVADNGSVFISKHVPTCQLCGNVEHVAEADGQVQICRQCLAQLMGEAGDNNV